jgi:2-iminobutanoate/2-iminopropanoate deaminase
MTPWDPSTGKIERGTIAEQTRLVLENIKRIVIEAGGNLADTVSCRVYIANLNQEKFRELNAVYAEYFSGENPPARATVGAQLPGDFDVEIECVVAMKK